MPFLFLKKQSIYIFQQYQKHNEKQFPLLSLLIHYITIRSTPQILSLYNEYTLRFSNFLIIGLCNS